MATVTVLRRGVANNQEANWIPTIPANDGLSVQNDDGDYVASGNDGLGNPKNAFDLWNDITATFAATPVWIDDGTLSAPGVTINSVTVHIIHGNFDGSNDLDVWFGVSTGGGEGATHGYATPGDLGGYSLLPGGVGGPYVEYISAPLVTNPKNGAAWTADDLFLSSLLGGTQSFYFDKFRDGGSYPNYSNYRINQIYLVVDYTAAPPVPTEVAVTGAGGVLAGGAGSTTGAGGVRVGGAARTFGIGAGTPPELSLNQWGLEGFTLFPRAEEKN